ncbi:N-acetylmuramoyl-L-alanine amidase [Nonomuraea sp. NPDC051191]|uniref:N-acetylmuramoyl-L-alanine amidase n=1 Tax=Nonomuraea sp. NPDC051191 TaxID=3364372 RepID=UPI0037966EAA
MKKVSRASWNAIAPSGPYSRISSPRGVKIHYTGGPVPADIAGPTKHRLCVQHVHQIQQMHMSGGRGETYIDIGYNLICCPHGYTFIGRGVHHLPAANGPGLNSGHYAVLGLVGSSGFTKPNNALLHALRDAIEYLREEGGAGNEIKGHRDGYSTSCPGDGLYAWVKRGAPRPDEPLEKPIKITYEDGIPLWPGRVIRLVDPCMQGNDVKTWQYKLRKRGWTIDVDGIYGPKSKAVCASYQDKVGAKPTGVIDETTWDLTWSWKPPAV